MPSSPETILDEADALIADGHLGKACRLLKTALQETPQEFSSLRGIRKKLFHLLIQRGIRNDAGLTAYKWLEAEPDNIDAKLCLLEFYLRYQFYTEAAALLPVEEAEGRADYAILEKLTHLWNKRNCANVLWFQGLTEEALPFYDNIHSLEASMIGLLEKAGPLWDLVFAALGKEGEFFSSWPLLSAQTEEHLAAFREAFLEKRTKGAFKTQFPGKRLAALTYHSIAKWPKKEQIVWQAKQETPRVYTPSSFDRAVPPAPQPVLHNEKTTIIRLSPALIYDNGNFFLAQTEDGFAPCLQEGVWGGLFSFYLNNILPSPHYIIEGRTGLCSAISFLPEPQIHIKKPLVMIGYFNNFGHFLHDIVPQIRLVEEHLGRDISFLVVDDLMPIIRQILAKLGYGEDRLVSIGEKRSALCDELYCLSPATLCQKRLTMTSSNKFAFRHYDMALDDDGVRFARQKLMGHKQNPKPQRKIYVSRRNAPRHVLNEEELERALVDRGFEIVMPETLSLDGQIALFSETAFVVAQEGSALANMTFMQKGAKILSLRTPSWEWTVNCFDELARIFELDYRTFDFEGRSVDAAAVAARIDSF